MSKTNSKQKYDEAEVSALLADSSARIKCLATGDIYRAEYWRQSIWLLTLEGKSTNVEGEGKAHNTTYLCNPDRFIFFKEITKLELFMPKLLSDELSIQEVVADSYVGELFETEGATRLELVEINPSSNYARYVFKHIETNFVNGFSADLQTSNNRPVHNPDWKIVRKLCEVN